MVRFRDVLLLLLALLMLTAVIGAAVLISRSRSQPNPSATPATRSVTATSAIQGTARPTSTLSPRDATSTPQSHSRPTGTAPTPTTDVPDAAPSATATSTVTAAPTPTRTPSPTPEPAARLADAHRARRNGDYAYARAELDRVANTSENADEIVTARYQAALLAYQDNDLEAARNQLDRFIAGYPGDHRIPTAHFYHAETLAALGDYPPALEHYAAYLTYQDVLADVVYARVGRIHRFLGDHQAAVQAYSQAVQHAPDLSAELDMREQTALAYQAQQDYENAQAEFYTIVDRSENSYRLARIWYRLGGNYRLLGDEQGALDAYAQATAGDPRPSYAHMALVELVNAGVEVDEYQRGLIDYYVGSYQAAIDAFARYTEATPDYDGDAHYYAARSWLAQGDPARALQECERALARPEGERLTGSRWGDLWLLKAEALSEQRDTDRAVGTYVQFARAYPDHPLAPEALWQGAYLLQLADRHAEAADSYAALADRYPDADRAPQARFRAGLWRYWIGDVDAALEAWRTLAETYPDAPEGQQGRYWLGKTLWARGQGIEARRELEELARQHPRSYYGLRAAHLAAANGQAVPWRHAPIPAHLTYSEAEEKQAVVDWLRTWADLSAYQPDSQVSGELAGHLRFRRAIEMHALGLRDLALVEFDALRQELQDPFLLYQLALVTRDLEFYAPSLRAAVDLTVLAPQISVLDMPRLVQRLAFPAYYSDLVLAESATVGLDPLLFFALIRQESAFDDQVSSWAGAVGLTQIMPATGQWIAEMTAWPEYEPELLKRAYLNVRFGVWFLDRLLDQADGDVMTALAGYNGGPALAAQWQENARGDPDLFVEVIPKNETQRYVQAIYRNYAMYMRLYGDGSWQLGEERVGR